ncbi:MAG: M1 family metallopeptidase [Flavobacteriales bacterium]|nr:M1 family metallopeptidase [Flavobacteriales bacterium]
MKNLFVLIFICLSTLGFSQQKTGQLIEYQSSSNQYYWKNRKPFEGYWQQDVHYVIDAQIDDKEESVTGQLRLTYWNNSPDALDRVYFHLYQNAFTPNSYLTNMTNQDKIQTKFGYHEGLGEGTVIKSFKINGNVVSYTIDNTILMANLAKKLEPNQGLTFDIEFVTYWDKDDAGSLRRRMKTFRHGGKDDKDFLHFDGVHWYPRITVYDRKFGWTTDQHLGKEFYGDYGVYEVNLTFPNQYIVEATGNLLNKTEVYTNGLRDKIDVKNYKDKPVALADVTNAETPNGTTKTWSFMAINVHDFAFTADPTYRIGEVMWKGISCIALVQEEHAHTWQQSAQFVADVVKTYSEKVGMYAYPKMIAADARDGMEYPMLTLDGGSFPGHKGLLAHEIGHNWFFGMVGNNETYQASLDEGFTQFLTAMSQKILDNVNTMPNYRDDGTVFYGYMYHAINENSARLNIHSDHFNSAERHGGGYGQVYYKTATMLYNLQYVLGDELFAEAFANYFDQWKICHPYWEDFRTSIIQYTKVDLNWFFDEWIENTSTIDYAVKNVKSLGENKYEITFERKGMEMPIDFTVIGKNGSLTNYHIPNNYFVKKTSATVLPTWKGWDLINKEYKAVVEIADGIKDVIIDPSGRLADINQLNNSKKCPVNSSLDKMQFQYSSFRNYRLSYRPDIWWNAVDGVKAGVKFSGDYFYIKHKFNAYSWYNTGLGAIADDSVRNNRDLLSYQIDYQTRLYPNVDFAAESRWVDGWRFHRVGVSRLMNKGNVGFSLASADRTNAQYLIYQEFANAGMDNWMEAKLTRNLKQMKGNGTLTIKAQAPFLFTDYAYSSVSAELLNNRSIKKMNLKTRVFGQMMDGNIAPEAMLQLSGANTYDLMNSRYTRSIGWLTQDPLTYSRNGNHLHQGGGLNIRGFSGVQATNNNETDSFYIYSGSRGLAFNAELDFGNYINPKLKKLGRKININPYLFTDLGVLGNANNQYSDLRMDAGVGANFALLFNNKWTATKPLNIRVDLPFFLNRIPEEQNDYLKFRYVVGINRAF